MTDAPAWARGFDLAFLTECAAVLKADLKPHCYGAFGLPKERDVADALAAGGLAWTRMHGEAIVAVAIFRVLASGSTHSDFAGREAKIRAGECLIRYLGGSAEGKAKLLDHFAGLASGALWAEAHVEHGKTVELLEHAGFERVMTKIAASSDLRGLFVRGSTRRPAPLDPRDIPALSVLREDFISPDEQAAILAEAEAGAEWAQHYSGYNKRHSWTAFALAGYDAADPGFIIKPAEMSKQWKAENPARLRARCGPTVAAERFPRAMAAVARLPGKTQRVRLMRLAAHGGELSRHADITDPEAGTADGAVSRLHIPLRSPAGCRFRGWTLDGAEHQIHFPERALCYLDVRKPHSVKNEGETDRIHLVVDLFSGPELRGLITAWPEPD